jgi:gamma-glutamyltranspeptidase/glutathione hydrolase
MFRKQIFFVLGLVVFLWQAQVHAAPIHPAIATAHPLATQAGLDILEQGGNAFDAAVAISATLAVVEPASSGLGGGGFWLLHRQEDGMETMIDGRERAPFLAYRDMYLDENGKVIKDLSRAGALSAGIPGLPAALVHIAKKYGRLPLATSLQPAILHAFNGFTIGERHRRMLGFRHQIIKQSEAAASIFLENGEVPQPDTLLVQNDLGKTLALLAHYGTKGFYAGGTAEKLIREVKKAGGIWSLQDLEAYQIIERKPIHGSYRGIKITSAPPPSSGGIVLIEALNILSAYDLESLDAITRKHLIVEALRRAYYDRARYLGDPDFVDIPQERLLDHHYAAGLRSTIRPDKALPSEHLSGWNQDKEKGADTTHFSIIDREGNRVSATLSINFPFGSGFVAAGTGVLLNNEMDDFVSLTGAMNGYGLVGGKANSIEPGKRMLSSMTPTFLENDKRIAVLGTPGGSRIISMVLLAILDFSKGNDPESWVKIKRFHHQYIPDQILYEKDGLTESEIIALTKLGHQLKEKKYRYGNMQAVQFNKQTKQLSAASDPRGEGLAVPR